MARCWNFGRNDHERLGDLEKRVEKLETAAEPVSPCRWTYVEDAHACLKGLESPSYIPTETLRLREIVKQREEEIADLHASMDAHRATLERQADAIASRDAKIKAMAAAVNSCDAKVAAIEANRHEDHRLHAIGIERFQEALNRKAEEATKLKKELFDAVAECGRLRADRREERRVFGQRVRELLKEVERLRAASTISYERGRADGRAEVGTQAAYDRGWAAGRAEAHQYINGIVARWAESKD